MRSHKMTFLNVVLKETCMQNYPDLKNTVSDLMVTVDHVQVNQPVG